MFFALARLGIVVGLVLAPYSPGHVFRPDHVVSHS